MTSASGNLRRLGALALIILVLAGLGVQSVTPTFAAVRNILVNGTTDCTSAVVVHSGTVGDPDIAACIRSAIIYANANSGSTIRFDPATNGVPQLLILNNCAVPPAPCVPGVDNGDPAINDIDVTASVTIIGNASGGPVTIIDGNGLDKIFSFNPSEVAGGCTPATGIQVIIQNLKLQNGKNQRSFASDCDSEGGAFDFDAGISGSGTLSLTNVTATGNQTSDGDGGAIALFEGGTVTISGSSFTNNQGKANASTVVGGGIFVGSNLNATTSNLTITDSSITGNTMSGNSSPDGGGIYMFNNSGGGSTSYLLRSVTISNNSARQGGAMVALEPITLNNAGSLGPSVISGNSSITTACSPSPCGTTGDGGGLYLNGSGGSSITKTTITGNSTAGHGGGIAVGTNGTSSLTMSYSRLAGNTATLGGSNLYDNTAANLTVTNNWWGTNTPAGTISNQGGGGTTFDPFITLIHTASPATIRINQNSTLTASMNQDNHGTAVGAPNLDVINGLAITFNNAILGSIPQPQPESFNASGVATATYNAGATGGAGHADAVVDQATVTANITVLEPASITKSFLPTTVGPNLPSTLTFSVTNGNVIAIDANFTDSLPATLVVATTPSVTNTCGGSVVAVAGSGSISFSNPTLAIGTCTITVQVQSASDGVMANSVTIDSTAAGTGNTSNANLTVIIPPSILKAFGTSPILVGANTSLTFTVNSPDVNTTLNGVAFTDTLPAGLVVATPGNLNSTCGGTATAADGSGSVSLSGASLAPGATCTISVDVTGATAGVKNNSVTVSSTNGGTGNTSNASVTVNAPTPPAITKSFGLATILVGQSTTLSFSIANPNAAVSLTGVAFTDTLPAGLVVATPNGLTALTGCGPGVATATAGSGSVSLASATIAGSGTCVFTVNVTGATAGAKNNSVTVTSTNGGGGNTSNASVTVNTPGALQIAKSFAAPTIVVGQADVLTFTITNPSAVAQTNVAFSDTFPAGLVVSTPNGLSSLTGCGGAIVTATVGSGAVNFSGGSIVASGSCTFSVSTTGAATGAVVNTTGTVSSNEGGTGNTASAPLTINKPAAPTITKSFGAGTIVVGQSTSLTFTMTNPNPSPVGLTGVAFTDTLPAGLVVATPNGLTGPTGCGAGSVTATAGSGSISFSGASIAAGATCTFAVNVTGTTAGTKTNVTGAITSNESLPGLTGSATLTVNSPTAQTITKAFGAANITLGQSTSLTFTITNPNPFALTNVAFTDTLPAGLVVSTPNGLTGVAGCGAGAITATAGSGAVSLSGAGIAANGTCTFVVNVTSTSVGVKNNTTGAVTSTEGGSGNQASASVTVTSVPAGTFTVNKDFIPDSAAAVSISVTCTAGIPAASPLPATEAAPAVFTINSIGGGNTCTATESVPVGYIANQAPCAAVALASGSTASCTITNTLNPTTATFTVSKDFIPDSAAAVSINVTCTAGTPAVSPLPATEAAPAVFTINGVGAGNTCTATEAVPAGYTASQATCAAVALAAGGTANCTITNTAIPVTPPTVTTTSPATAITTTGATLSGNVTSIGGGALSARGIVLAQMSVNPNPQIGGTGVTVLTDATSVLGAFSENASGLLAGTNYAFVAYATNAGGTSYGSVVIFTTATQPPPTAGGPKQPVPTPAQSAPVATKKFNGVLDATVPAVGTNVTLTFTVTNPNATALTGVGFVDTMPNGSGLTVVAGSTVGNCDAGIVLLTSTTVTLAGATLPANSSCSFSVTVTAATLGSWNNYITANANGTGFGPQGAATLNVGAIKPPKSP